jgi:hypothetical protein
MSQGPVPEEGQGPWTQHWAYGPSGRAPGYPVPGYGAFPEGTPPPTFLAWARIAAVCGALFNLIIGLPLAIVAMTYGRKVRQHWESGDAQGAYAASRRARIFATLSTVFDSIGVVLVAVVIIAQVASAKSNFDNPAVLAASIKMQLQKRISDPSSQFYRPGLKVTSVVCTPIRTNTDRCVDHFSNGLTVTEIAVISAGGNRYVTH